MIMTPLDFQNWQYSVEKDIFDKARKWGLTSKKLKAIADGVADAEAYLSSSPKVAWIGKEPYDLKDSNGNPCGGNWSLTEGFINTEDWSKAIPTWKNVIYTMYGLRNGLHYWDKEMPYVNNNMGDVMCSIAWINLSKMPNRPNSSDYAFADMYRKHWKETVMKQLDFYKPDVLIFCNTFSICYSDLFPTGSEPIEVPVPNKYIIKYPNPILRAFKRGDQLFLDAYHPGARFNEEKRGDYVDSIIDTVRTYFK